MTILFTGCGQPLPITPADTPAPARQLGFDPADLDTTTRPQDDFYAYVNSLWIQSTRIPPEWTKYGTMQIVYEKTEQQLKTIIQTAATNTDVADSDSKKTGDLYNSFMNTVRTEELGLSPLIPELERINALRNYEELIHYFGQALAIGITVPIDFYIDADAAQPDKTLAYIWQGGLGLPDREYYLSESPQLVEIRSQYHTHIDKMFSLAGWANAADAETIISIEKQLAEQHWSRVQNRDREKIYSSKYTVTAANTLSPGFDWTIFLNSCEFGIPEQFIIAQTDYFAALGQIIRSIPVADWRTYLRFNVLRAYAPYLNEAIVTEDFNFSRRILRGQEQIRPRWKRGIRLVNASLGEAIGKIYIEQYFPADSKQRIDMMIENLRVAFQQSIDSLEWMTDQTKQAAQEKLALFTTKIGYPEKWQDYTTLKIDATDLIGNVRRAYEFSHREAIAKLAKPVDRSEWGMTPQTVNAYYRPTLNEIVFPAAILQPPFFDVSADDAFNYGAIGSVIGHEFSHGFDDQGRKFDGRGRLADWWTEDDASEYEIRSAGLVKQYDAFLPIPDQAVNGKLTLGENIADLAGLIIAYRAWQILIDDMKPQVINGFSGDERFFIGYAQTWRTKIREESLREMLLSDPHSPPNYRVIGVLQNMQEFYTAFGITSGDGMYLPDEQRVHIW
ncbi:MAG: M13 family metallopeptidase [Gammaproteobacteria bacterium]|jgi:predicted metalloendopeptidase|nr:M13 family metallopeptidase [Gammaproteobacteria bacterium]MDP6675363.1 M13 family metallopeptidase [Gammaproteobacteria bacterium]